jgi:RNA polymerase sigma-70 factor (ECF subfamily)
MADESEHTPDIQYWINRLQAGDTSARNQLLTCACQRLRRLTRKLLKGYPRVRWWEETDDVLDSAIVRLCRAFEQVIPRSARDFFCLAARHIRWELIDLARHYYGPEGMGANLVSLDEGNSSDSTPRRAFDKADTSHEPNRLAVWSEFHQHVEALPEEEREVFDLLWYHGLTQDEAAAVLGVCLGTVKSRWRKARRKVYQALKGELPGS